MAVKKKSQPSPSKAEAKTNKSKAAQENPMQKLVGDVLGKDDKKKKKDEESNVSEQIKDIRQFLKEVYIEFQKITWPDRAQVIRETYSVIFLVTIITLMVLAFDWAIGKAVFGPLEHWARVLGGGISRT